MMSRQGQRAAGLIVAMAVAVLTAGCDGGAPPVMGSADMVIKGHMVDEQGKPLRGVVCRVESFSPGGHEGLMSRRVRSVEPDFELSFDKVIRADLTFMADGYEYLDVAFEANSPAGDVKMVDKTQHYERTFTLVKRQAVPTLHVYSPTLRILTDGSYRMCRLDGVDISPFEDPLKHQRYIMDTTTALSVTYPYIYANLRPQPGEEPVMSHYEFGESYEESPRDKVAQLCLANGEPGDGFFLFPMQPKDYKSRFFPPEMTTVPEGATYSACVDMDKSNFMHSDARPFPCAYFYFKLKGKFGKGRVQPGYHRSDGSTELRVELYIQPDGSRDVRTRGE